MHPCLIIQNTCAVRWKVPFSDSELQALSRAMLGAAGLSGASAELSILDDVSMARLHLKSLACQGPTNILSFPGCAVAEREDTGKRGSSGATIASLYPEEAGTFLGWLALSADTLERECFLYGQPVEDHCIRLLAHGLAHLMGHDHGPAMEQLCDKLEQAAQSCL